MKTYGYIMTLHVISIFHKSRAKSKGFLAYQDGINSTFLEEKKTNHFSDQLIPKKKKKSYLDKTNLPNV